MPCARVQTNPSGIVLDILYTDLKMELQTAKYYQEPEPTKRVEYTTFCNPGDGRPEKPPTHAEERSILLLYAALAVLVIGWLASMYAICQVFRIPVEANHRNRAQVKFNMTMIAMMGRVLSDYCKNPEDSWVTYGVSSAMVIAALVAIGCVPRNKNSKKVCKDSVLAHVALGVGEQLRGQGRHAVTIAMGYMLAGTIAACVGLTWMISLYQDDEKGALSVIIMSVVSQLGIAAFIGGMICMLRAPDVSPAPIEQLAEEPSTVS